MTAGRTWCVVIQSIPGDYVRERAGALAAEHADRVERHRFGHSGPETADDPGHVGPVPVTVSGYTFVSPRIEGREGATTEFDVRRADARIDHVDVDACSFG